MSAADGTSSLLGVAEHMSTRGGNAFAASLISQVDTDPHLSSHIGWKPSRLEGVINLFLQVTVVVAAQRYDSTVCQLRKS